MKVNLFSRITYALKDDPNRTFNRVALVGMLLSLILVNLSIFQKEQHLADGQTVLLKLAPVDPRSLMQGDYMALRFEIANDLFNVLPLEESDSLLGGRYVSTQGQIVVYVDERGVGHLDALYEEQPLNKNQLVMNYRLRNDVVKFATNAFFFEEGQADVFEIAEYGQFKVADDGELLLVAMFDKNLKKLGDEAK
jgi:uncharacterized membrane-anchored protein